MKTKEWLKDFRNQLGLTQRQFAVLRYCNI